MGDTFAIRSILHIDMNAFYCSCHAAADPKRFANRPTAVAGNPETRHGVLVTASYQARQRGVKATMTVPEALRLCPELTLIAPDFELYRAYSRRAFALIEEYTPLIEIFSIDECWADITGSSQFGSAKQIADTIQSRLLAELSLPCSIGISPNKFLAKMASDFKKPLGITEIKATDVAVQLWPLPVGQMFGVGKSSAERLQRIGIRTIGDLAKTDMRRLVSLFGKRASVIHQHANGLDDTPVSAEREPAKSIGHSITLATDSADPEELRAVLLNLSDQVGRRARRHGLMGRTVQVTIRFSNRKTVTRSKTLLDPTDLTEEVYLTALSLLTQHRHADQRVRLLGVSLSQLLNPNHSDGDLDTGTQLHLFADLTQLGLAPASDTAHARAVADSTNVRQQIDVVKLRKLADVTDRLRDKYGEDIVVRGRMLQPHESNQLRDGKSRGTSLQKDTLGTHRRNETP